MEIGMEDIEVPIDSGKSEDDPEKNEDDSGKTVDNSLPIDDAKDEVLFATDDPEDLLRVNDPVKRAEFFSRKCILSSMGDNEEAKFPADCYSFISLHGPTSGYFWFGIMAWAFQISFLLTLIISVMHKHWSKAAVDDNPGSSRIADFLPTNVDPVIRTAQFLALLTSVVFVDASMMDVIDAISTFPDFSMATKRDRIGFMAFSCILRFSQGILAIMAGFFLIVTSETVMEILLNFAALNFLSTLDEMAFEFARSGKYGPRLQKEVKRIEELPLPVCMFRQYQHIRYYCTIVPLFFVLIGTLALIFSWQVFNPNWDTQILRVQIADNALKGYNGCYRIDSDAGTLWQRSFFVGTEHNKQSARLGFCIEEDMWYLYEGDQSQDPCTAEVQLHSSKTDTIDISTVFQESWFTDSNAPADLYFFEKNDPDEIDRHCGSFLGDGKCDEIFNNAFDNYDDGDCCAATCTHSSCGTGGIFNAFNSTDTVGDGYAHCIDPTMKSITIRLNSVTYSRDKSDLELSEEDLMHIDTFIPGWWDTTPERTRLALYCDGATVMKFYITSDMVNQSETVMIGDGAYCEIYIDNSTSSNPDIWDPPIWYVDYTVYDGDQEQMTSRPTPILQENSYYIGDTSFKIIPECFFEQLSDHIDCTCVYELNKPSSRAIDWMLKVESESKLCSVRYGSQALLIRYALTTLNFAAPNLASESLWVEEKPVCQWKSIWCVGDLPTELDSFQLDLSALELSGYIATEIGLLSNLFRFDAGYNMLDGTIPSEIGLLTDLRELVLVGNDLTGSIPSEIGLLTLLEGIFIDRNSLTGSIPSQIGLLTNLMRLFVTDNDLTGSIPSEIGLLTSLDMIYTDENRLMGSVPSEIGLLTNLNVLKINKNSLTGTIPTEMEGLLSLDRLRMDGNYIPIDSVPASLATKLVERCIICGGGIIPSSLTELVEYANSDADKCSEKIMGLNPDEDGNIAIHECDLIKPCFVCPTNSTEIIGLGP